MLKAVIFDMDGVIVDSEPLHAEAAQKTIEAFGVSLPIEYFYQFIGSTTKNIFTTTIRENNVPVSLEEALALDKEICKKLQEERGNTPVPGAID